MRTWGYEDMKAIIFLSYIHGDMRTLVHEAKRLTLILETVRLLFRDLRVHKISGKWSKDIWELTL